MTDIRAGLEQTMRAWLADEAANQDTDYAAVRPLPLYGAKGGGYPKGKKRSDCSWGARLVCWWTAGAPDPMGTRYEGGGNSSTICFALHEVGSPAELEVGDPVTFGPGGDEHVALTLEPGADPLMFSDGHQGAPNTYRLSYDTREKQLRKLPVAPPPLTRQEKLQAATGWFSWMKWLLGEGEWKPYGSKNQQVRPSVPRVVPLSWWARRARFLLNRRKGDAVGGPVTNP